MKQLTLLEAENKRRHLRWIGWPLLILSTTLYAVAGFKGIYSWASNPGDQLSAIFLRPFANLIALLYWKTPGVRTLWSILPDCNLANWRDPSNANFYLFFAMFFGLMCLGSQLRLSGNALSKSIASARQKAQEDQWRHEIFGRHGTAAPGMILIDISVRDQWWSRPAGILGLAIIAATISGIIVQAINVWLKLAH